MDLCQTPDSNRPQEAPLVRARRRFCRARVSRLLTSLGLVLLISASVSTSTAQAVEIEDIDFPAAIPAGESEINLFGLGLLRYRVVFRGYVGGLYLPAEAKKGAAFEDVPKALELYYFWDIPGRFFGEAADDLLAKNLPTERVTALRSRLDRLNGLYLDVEEGDRYRLTYVPGEGTHLLLNGKELGVIPGADFARDYFSIWLGDKPLSEPFRDQIFKGL
ncbi:MAG: chalcone isomerase family protein [Myxococcota bacterium]